MTHFVRPYFRSRSVPQISIGVSRWAPCALLYATSEQPSRRVRWKRAGQKAGPRRLHRSLWRHGLIEWWKRCASAVPGVITCGFCELGTGAYSPSTDWEERSVPAWRPSTLAPLRTMLGLALSGRSNSPSPMGPSHQTRRYFNPARISAGSERPPWARLMMAVFTLPSRPITNVEG